MGRRMLRNGKNLLPVKFRWRTAPKAGSGYITVISHLSILVAYEYYSFRNCKWFLRYNSATMQPKIVRFRWNAVRGCDINMWLKSRTTGGRAASSGNALLIATFSSSFLSGVPPSAIIIARHNHAPAHLALPMHYENSWSPSSHKISQLPQLRRPAWIVDQRRRQRRLRRQ